MIYKDTDNQNVEEVKKEEAVKTEEPVKQPETASLEEKKARQLKEKNSKRLIRVLITIVVIIVGVFLILWLIAKAANYNTVADMVNVMLGELDLMWTRIQA